MKNKFIIRREEDFHTVYEILGVKFKFRNKNNLIKNYGRNNHVYILHNNKEKQEIFYSPNGLSIFFSGNNNEILLKKPFGKHRNSKIQITKSNKSYTEIGEKASMTGTLISIHNGENQQCVIGREVSTSKDCGIYIHNNNKVIINKDCMFSQKVTIWASDGHAIIDVSTGQCININNKNVIELGEHCWIGYDVTILKNSKLGSNCIVSAKSLLNKDFGNINNYILAGIPWHPVKAGVSWDRRSPNTYQIEYENNYRNEIL